MTIRPAEPEDQAAIHAVVAAAFRQPDEADLVDALRADGDALLELVAVEDGAVVGHILFSPLATDNGRRLAALAPLSVQPGRQKDGLGTALIIGYGGSRVIAGTLSAGSLVAFYSYIGQIFSPMSTATELYARLTRVRASVKRLMDLEFEDQVVGLSEWRNAHYFGIYRGIVESVEEGDNLGIISVKIPDVFGSQHVVEKVRPCSPFAGDKHGFVTIPEVGDGVWIQFEAGQSSLPVWIGFWWATMNTAGPTGASLTLKAVATPRPSVCAPRLNPRFSQRPNGLPRSWKTRSLTPKRWKSTLTMTA